jgi:hypothetical protein
LIFQTLDDKKECVAIYRDQKLYSGQLPDDLTATWSYAKYLEDLDIEYASLYCFGKTLDDVCPEQYRTRWEAISNKLKAFLVSFNEAKINLNENCFFDMVPERFLLEFCEIKNKITEHVLENYEKPRNYDFLLSLAKMIHDIKYNQLNIESASLKSNLENYKTRQFYKKINNISPYIEYDISGTRTGRLTTKKDSFPIMTLDKAHRSVLRPKNDYFVELDFNAAELRTLLALTGTKQPEEDIHEWNVENVYMNTCTREEAKKRIFAWMYNPESKDHLSNNAYKREEVLRKYYDGTHVKTFFGRKIESDDHHALNYIIQSTTSDLFLRQAIKVWEMLKNRKSEIAFCIHDSLIIDYSFEENDILKDLVSVFSKTNLGSYKTNVSVGCNFGEMRKIR